MQDTRYQRDKEKPGSRNFWNERMGTSFIYVKHVTCGIRAGARSGFLSRELTTPETPRGFSGGGAAMVRRTPSDSPAAGLAEVRPTAAVLDASIEADNAGAVDTVMSWLSLHIPTWGSSLTLHVAVVLLVAFVATQAAPPPEVFSVVAGVLLKPPPVAPEQRPKQPAETSSSRHDTMRPGPANIRHELTDIKLPDVAKTEMNQLQILGIGPGGRDIGEDLGIPTGPGPTVFGSVTDPATRIVYVVDRSGSMTDSMDYVKFELKRSIAELGAQNEFHVIFYSSGPPVEMPARRLVAATERNLQSAFEFIDSVVPMYETDPSQALERAFAVRPDVIYLLTDGEFDRQVIGLVRRLNVGGKVQVHTIGFLYPAGEGVLKEIAAQNGGRYKFVSAADLAGMAGG